MRLDNNFWNRTPVNAAAFALLTLLAWATAASLFFLLERFPLTRGAPMVTYYAPLCSLLPWLVGCVFWAKVRKRARLGKADVSATSFDYSIIFIGLGAAYVAMGPIMDVLLWVLAKTR